MTNPTNQGPDHLTPATPDHLRPGLPPEPRPNPANTLPANPPPVDSPPPAIPREVTLPVKRQTPAKPLPTPPTASPPHIPATTLPDIHPLPNPNPAIPDPNTHTTHFLPANLMHPGYFSASELEGLITSKEEIQALDDDGKETHSSSTTPELLSEPSSDDDTPSYGLSRPRHIIPRDNREQSYLVSSSTLDELCEEEERERFAAFMRNPRKTAREFAAISDSKLHNLRDCMESIDVDNEEDEFFMNINSGMNHLSHSKEIKDREMEREIRLMESKTVNGVLDLARSLRKEEEARERKGKFTLGAKSGQLLPETPPEITSGSLSGCKSDGHGLAGKLQIQKIDKTPLDLTRKVTSTLSPMSNALPKGPLVRAHIPSTLPITQFPSTPQNSNFSHQNLSTKNSPQNFSNKLTLKQPLQDSTLTSQPLTSQNLTSQPLTSQTLTSQTLTISSNYAPFNPIPNPKTLLHPSNPSPKNPSHPRAPSTPHPSTSSLPQPGSSIPTQPNPCPPTHPRVSKILTREPPMGSPPPTNPWATRTSNPSNRLNLSYIQPPTNTDAILTLKSGTSVEGEAFWKNTLIGYSMEKRLPFKLLQQRAMSLWGKHGLTHVRTTKEGFYFFSFSSEEDVKQILHKAPWIILGQQIFLKPWVRNFDFCKDEFRTVRTWVKLYGIPTTYWTASGLSAIASKIGTPLFADEETASARLLNFARICIEMDVGSTFPHTFTVQTEFGETFEVIVEYGWRPKQCTHCKVFGHSTTSCQKNPAHIPSTSNPNKSTKHINPTQPPKTMQPKAPLPVTPLTPSDHPPTNQTQNTNKPNTPPITAPLAEPSPLPQTIPSPVLVDPTPPTMNSFNPISPLALTIREDVEPLATIPNHDNSLQPHPDPTVEVAAQTLAVAATPPRAAPTSRAPSVASDSSASPTLWGHKIKMVDELDRKKKKNLKKSLLRKKKRALASGSLAKGSNQPL